MNVMALILNLIIPGIGSFVVGKAGQGIGQILLWGIGLLISLTLVGALLVWPMMIGAWIWGIVTVVGSKEQQAPTPINIIQQVGGQNYAPTPDPQIDSITQQR